MAFKDKTPGALLMALAMASFTINDAFTKSVTPYINTGQIMFIRGLMTCVIIFIMAKYMGGLRPLKVFLRPIIIMRCVCELLASVFYLSALGLIDFANAAAILQSLPMNRLSRAIVGAAVSSRGKGSLWGKLYLIGFVIFVIFSLFAGK